jgi:membrane-bound lytic murein transglycosylase A
MMYDAIRMMRKSLFACMIFLVLAGCLASRQKEDLQSDFPSRTEWKGGIKDDGDRASLQAAVDYSLAYLRKKMAGKLSETERENLPTFQRTYESLLSFREILLHSSGEGEFERKVLGQFTFWKPGQGAAAGPAILTGYYEPVFEGSLRPGGPYRYPLYRIPDDLSEAKSGTRAAGEKRIVRIEKGVAYPYYTRREIDGEGALNGKGYEIAWLKDPLERFLLHVQGSGQIRLPDQKTYRVGFAGSNGRQYRSIGRYLVERGWLKEGQASMRHIKDFLRRQPEKLDEVLNVNERYVFFRPLAHKEGPLGALGVPLVGGRSVATDLTVYPPGALAYLVSGQPVCDSAGRIVARKPLRRFVLNQDTGAAMKGPNRIDFFCGTGEQAGVKAGEMREEAQIYFLVRK